jgi:hypothetical protein
MASQMSGAAKALAPAQEGPQDLEHEFDLVRSAIALIAAGGARRVTLVGLPLDTQALRDVGSLIRANGMSMRVMTGHVGCDITIEASG